VDHEFCGAQAPSPGALACDNSCGTCIFPVTHGLVFVSFVVKRLSDLVRFRRLRAISAIAAFCLHPQPTTLPSPLCTPNSTQGHPTPGPPTRAVFACWVEATQESAEGRNPKNTKRNGSPLRPPSQSPKSCIPSHIFQIDGLAFQLL
jgi:hypothetical protein